MKKIFLVFAMAVATVSCEKNSPSDLKEIKTAYVDTSKLLEEYTQAKDIDAKYKAKSETMGKQLEGEVAKFKAEAGSFQKDAQTNGAAWAQKKSAELQKREQQLSYAQQAMLRQLQDESGAEMDTMVKSIRKFIKAYGKEKGYAYIYGTGEAATILYAEEKYDITAEIVKLLNEKYKPIEKKEDSAAAMTEEKK